MRHLTSRISASLLCLLLLCGLGCRQAQMREGSTAASRDDVAYSFVVMGCNRIDWHDITSDNPSSANLPQLHRTFDEVSRLEPKPTHFFFVGDLVCNLQEDLSVLERQLRAWKEVYAQSPIAKSGIRMVALPGNHELLVLVDGKKPERPHAGTEAIWVREMAPFIVGDNGPGPGGPDKLVSDQSRLTYSFQFRDAHFVLMNTDTFDKPNTVPVEWIKNDIEGARKRADVKHIFVLGHKPAFSSPLVGEQEGLGLYPQQRARFWQVLNDNDCVALLVAHNHLYLRTRPPPGKTTQIITGNGGSKLVPGLSAEQSFYGYTLVSVLKDGRVTIKSMGRDLPPEGYMAPCPAEKYPTTVRDEADITLSTGS